MGRVSRGEGRQHFRQARYGLSGFSFLSRALRQGRVGKCPPGSELGGWSAR